MTLPYSASSSGEKAVGEMQKILRHFGCTKFGIMTDDERRELIVQFEFRGRMVSVKASAMGYASAWLKENPYTHRMRRSKVEHERMANQIASVAVYSVLRDWIKGQITAVETGILTFEGAFLGQIMLESGETVLEKAQRTKLLALPAADGNGESKP